MTRVRAALEQFVRAHEPYPHRGTDLAFLGTVATFGTAFDITLEEIAVETYLPADAGTMQFFTGDRGTSA
ncbi:hypothetical protein ACWF0M_06090 [Kribbella sp. NPDC055110]